MSQAKVESKVIFSASKSDSGRSDSPATVYIQMNKAGGTKDRRTSNAPLAAQDDEDSLTVENETTAESSAADPVRRQPKKRPTRENIYNHQKSIAASTSIIPPPVAEAKPVSMERPEETFEREFKLLPVDHEKGRVHIPRRDSISSFD